MAGGQDGTAKKAYRPSHPVTPFGALQQLTHRSRTTAAAARTVCAFNPPQIGRRLLFAFWKSHSVTPILSRVFSSCTYACLHRSSSVELPLVRLIVLCLYTYYTYNVYLRSNPITVFFSWLFIRVYIYIYVFNKLNVENDLDKNS